MQVFDWPRERASVEAFFNRTNETPRKVAAAVDRIIADVRRRGDAALVDYSLKFDKAKLKPADFAVPAAKLKAAWDKSPAKLKAALKLAARRIEAYHKRQRATGFVVNESGFGRIEQRVLPMARVGVYVPAGEAPLVSTVLMCAIPAKIAGVKEIILFSPPSSGGEIDAGILAAAHLVGVTKVYRLGSAWAVEQAAFGTATIPKVDKLVGPGNPYVTTAKQKLYGVIDIESTAGPSEVLILADGTAPLEFLAADMLAQAEHAGDNPVGVVLIGGNRMRADMLLDELEDQAARLSRVQIAQRSLDSCGFVINCKTAAQAVEIANLKAPEHLEIIAKGARRMAAKVTQASAIFVGPWTPEPVGDYIAGPNHTLPTGGTARFFSPLGVWSFCKMSHTIEATRAGLAKLSGAIITLAEAEGLTAHANAVKVRRKA